jgi:protein phosphatase PTC2/3
MCTGMEDAHSTILNLLTGSAARKRGNISFFAVFDGHGGSGTALFCGERMHHLLASTKEFEAGEYEASLKRTFLAMDEEILAGA